MRKLGGANGFIEKQNDYLLLVYTNEEIAEDGQFQAWWDAFDDIRAVFGLSEGIRLVVDPDQRAGQTPKWKYLVAHGFSGDAERMKRAIARHVTQGDSALWFYKAIAEQVEKPGKADDADEHIFMALTNVKPGRLDDFTEWYNTHHVRDVVRVECYRSGRRFHMEAAGGSEAPWEFLAFYRFVGPAAEMHDILRREMSTGKNVMSDAYESGDGAWIYRPV
ncbi:MAG: hypothetical protein LBL63_00615 [Clostridiales Family XIII bacterium]|jgi:hypothetical protein|nr:hypothetical protein [Clostridiales Family XIII bacterium]